jgi:hypothetical protein
MSFSKQRVFSTTDSNNYNDYLKLKIGETVLKNCKTNNKDACLHYFLNYQDFLILTKSYYNHLNNNKCNLQFQTNMYETNQSFVDYQELEIMKKNNIYPKSLEKIYCNKLLTILYPYGIYGSLNKSNIYYPNKINLKDWCLTNKKNIKCLNQENYIDKYIENDFSNPDLLNSPSSCGSKYNLCNGTKPLFI